MNEKELKRIREQLDQAPIPERLLPKQIEHQLNKLPRQKKSNYKAYTAAAAAILLLACSIPVLKHLQTTDLTSLNDNLQIANTSIRADHKEDQKIESSPATKDAYPNAAKTAQTYAEVYDKLLTSQDQTGSTLAGAGLEDGSVAFKEEVSASPSRSNSKTANSRATQTNTQVADVDESDIVKTDGTYLYLLDRDTLKIMKPSKNKGLITISEINAADPENQINSFYVNKTTLTLMETAYQDTMNLYIKVRVYDLKDPSSPKLLGTVSQDGAYQDSRMTDGYLYLITSYYIYDETNLKKPETYIPRLNDQILSAKQILLPEESNGTMYTLVTSLNTDQPSKFQDQLGILSDTSNCYVSTDTIYLTSSQYQTPKTNADSTRILKLGYHNGLITNQAASTIPGVINDQFSMDEADGYFRIFTTVHYQDGNTKNILYILDRNLEKYASLGKLAPGESIQSARFIGNTAYLVTFRLTDPLFSIDLSDPASPKLLGQLKIPGFSEYLHPFSDNLLLGIGQETDSNGQQIGLKLSMFDISDPLNVKEVHKLVLKHYYYSSLFENHKNIMLDLNSANFGLTANGSSKTASGDYQDYILYHYDPQNGFTPKLQSRISSDILTAPIDYTRGVVIDQHLYVISSGECIQIYDTKNYKLQHKINLQ